MTNLSACFCLGEGTTAAKAATAATKVSAKAVLLVAAVDYPDTCSSLHTSDAFRLLCRPQMSRAISGIKSKILCIL